MGLKKSKKGVLKKVDPNSTSEEDQDRRAGDDGDDRFTQILKTTEVKTRAKANAAYSSYKFSFEEGSPTKNTIGSPNIRDCNIENKEVIIHDLSSATAAARNSAWLNSFDKRMQEALGRAGI